MNLKDFEWVPYKVIVVCLLVNKFQGGTKLYQRGQGIPDIYIIIILYISESTVVLYVGMAREKNGRPYISIGSDKLKSLVICTYKL